MVPGILQHSCQAFMDYVFLLIWDSPVVYYSSLRERAVNVMTMVSFLRLIEVTSYWEKCKLEKTATCLVQDTYLNVYMLNVSYNYSDHNNVIFKICYVTLLAHWKIKCL